MCACSGEAQCRSLAVNLCLPRRGHPLAPLLALTVAGVQSFTVEELMFQCELLDKAKEYEVQRRLLVLRRAPGSLPMAGTPQLRDMPSENRRLDVAGRRSGPAGRVTATQHSQRPPSRITESGWLGSQWHARNT